MDNKRYFFVKKNNKWSFITKEIEYKTNYIPLEKWISKNTVYTLSRVCYTKEEAESIHTRILNDRYGMMNGINLYVITNERDETIISIYNLNCNIVEIEFKYKNQGSGNPRSLSIVKRNCKVQMFKDSVTFEELKQYTQKLMGLNDIKITNISNEYNHIC